MTPTREQEDRAQFEAWAKELLFSPKLAQASEMLAGGDEFGALVLIAGYAWQAARAQALEDAAGLCSARAEKLYEHAQGPYKDMAKAIRALKGKP